MATVQRPKAQPIYHAGKKNTVLACTDARMLVIRYTDSETREHQAVVMVYGADAQGQPGVIVVSDSREMGEMSFARTYIASGVAQWIREQNPDLDDLPAEPVDIGSVPADVASDSVLDTAAL